MLESLTFEPFGEQAILISWPNEISTKTSQDIYFFNQKIQSLIPKHIVETVATYCSLTVFTKYDCDKNLLISTLKELYKTDCKNEIESTLWEIPVCYDLSFAIDLENLAKQKNITIQELIQLHSQTTYTVDFLGFLPGFPYLSGLNPKLHTPRLSTPRQAVAKGSVAIGGKQTGIYPIQSPAGWHIIGRTKVDFFDSSYENPCFIKPMDKIKFTPISLDEFNHD